MASSVTCSVATEQLLAAGLRTRKHCHLVAKYFILVFCCLGRRGLQPLSPSTTPRIEDPGDSLQAGEVELYKNCGCQNRRNCSKSTPTINAYLLITDLCMQYYKLHQSSDVPVQGFFVMSLLKRKWNQVQTESNSSLRKPTVRVMQWNALADSLSDAFPHTDASTLKWTFRSRHLCKHILAVAPDVLALEEVDHFADYFEPKLKEKGYEGIFQKKPSKHSADGVCLFWNTKTFKLVESKILSYENSNQVAVMALLEFQKDSKAGICVVGTHLKAKVGFEADRESQGKQLVEAIPKFNTANFPTIICGDFNDTPDSLVYKVVNSHYDSAYVINGAEAPWTTWKKREDTVKRTIDYIWYDKDRLVVSQVLGLPKDSKCPDLLPASYFPSDHMSIAAEFKFKSTQQK